MHLAEDLDWIEKNPTKRFKLRFDQVDMVYLSKAELQKIKNKNSKELPIKSTGTFSCSAVILDCHKAMSRS
jgi:hypothetical protein